MPLYEGIVEQPHLVYPPMKIMVLLTIFIHLGRLAALTARVNSCTLLLFMMNQDEPTTYPFKTFKSLSFSTWLSRKTDP